MTGRPPIQIYEPPVIPLGRPATVRSGGCPPVGARRKARPQPLARRRAVSKRRRLQDLFAEKRALEARLEHVLNVIAEMRGGRQS